MSNPRDSFRTRDIVFPRDSEPLTFQELEVGQEYDLEFLDDCDDLRGLCAVYRGRLMDGSWHEKGWLGARTLIFDVGDGLIGGDEWRVYPRGRNTE